MNEALPSPTPVPIHDITGPVWVFPYPVWMVAVAAAAVLAALGLLLWLVFRKRKARPLTPRERALAALAEIRREPSAGDSHVFGIRVSDALRAYVRDQYGLDAVTRTSVEFLEAMRDHVAFTDNERAALSEFLESADLLKYARLEAGSDERQALLDIAGRFVRGEHAVSTEAAR